MSLTEQQINVYRAQGFLSGIPIAEEAEAGRYRRLFDALEEKEGREKTRIGLVDRHFEEPFIWELATHPKILDGIASLIGPAIFTQAFAAFIGPGAGLHLPGAPFLLSGLMLAGAIVVAIRTTRGSDNAER